jgi:hypothetical protein
MSAAADLDVRLPIGGLFTVLGLMLAGYGLTAGSRTATASSAISTNINLWWGVVMLVFGLLLLLGSFLARRRLAAHPAMETPEGQSTEERERRLGLEH